MESSKKLIESLVRLAAKDDSCIFSLMLKYDEVKKYFESLNYHIFIIPVNYMVPENAEYTAYIAPPHQMANYVLDKNNKYFKKEYDCLYTVMKLLVKLENERTKSK